MKITKKILSLIIGAVLLIAISVIALSIYKATNGKAQIITSTKLKEAIGINELSTGEFVYNGITQVPDKDNPEKTSYNIKYNSVVKAGILTDNIDFEIDRNNKTITPVFPEIRINSVVVDSNGISFIPENTDASIKDALQACEFDATTEANKENELFNTAKENLIATIEALLDPIVKNQGYKILWN